MPHLIVEYSSGLFPDDAPAIMLRELNETVVGSGAVLKESDLKSRMVERNAWQVGTTGAARGFVHAQLRMLSGRSPEMRAELGRRIADVLRARCARPAGVMLQLSVEIAEMERGSYVKEIL